ncbi:uncharacterized protein LOC127802562 isoform X2 [Diospyros lotus]|uniref:uncharacterized protein LOC127802562 isoform X2 n=1 Tax=Diospyros lotus TaxID=55363 RepID=UPI00225AF7B2|nr:uncharacterized protein LOC127802562 isoform X2 [Diospyros lotus]
MMRVFPRKQLFRALLCSSDYFPASASSSSTSSRRALTLTASWLRSQPSPGVLTSPWSAMQLRGAKYRGSDVKPGNVIEKKGKIYQVLKAQHTVQGRGGACIQVELRDVDSGNKINERFRTDEAIENLAHLFSTLLSLWAAGVFVEEKPYTYLYTEDDVVVLSEPNTFDQLDVPRDLFGEAAVYLKDEMTVTVQLYDGKPMSASVPQRVTCKVVEAQVPMKGIAATPHYKKVLLDNGLNVQGLGVVLVLASSSFGSSEQITLDSLRR